MIHLFRPDVGWRESLAVVKTLHSRWLGPGPNVARFEDRLRDRFGQDVLTLASATDALFLSMELLGIGPGDEVIVPSIHFVGAASAVLVRGAEVVLCDVDPHTLTARAQDIKAVMTPRTKAVMLLHYGGHMADVRGIRALGLPVVEDAALSYRVDGDLGLVSFDAMKLMTTGGSGGLLVGRNLERARLLTRLGITQQHGLTSHRERWWEYWLVEPGRLSEMNDLQAAIGLVQLDRLDRMIERRRALWELYTRALSGYVQTPSCCPGFYWIQTERRDELARHLRERGIYTSFRYYPLHRAMGRPGLPGADYAADHTLLLPYHNALTDRQARYICREIGGFLHG